MGAIGSCGLHRWFRQLDAARQGIEAFLGDAERLIDVAAGPALALLQPEETAFD